jgi:putative transposase
LAIVDDFTRECLALHIDHSLGTADVIREFDRIAFERDLPRRFGLITAQSLPAAAMLRWAAEQDVELHYIAPGKPTRTEASIPQR